MIINIALIVASILLITSILLQQRGSGLGTAFGGEGAVYTTKRGAEKFIFWASIVLSIIFFGLGITRILL